MRQVAILFALVFLSGCAGNKVLVRSMDATIIDAAARAKAAGASAVSVELSVTSGYKAGASIPISVVIFGGEASVNNTAKVTATISDLSKWVQPKQITEAEENAGYFILNTGTLMLKEARP